MYKMVFFQAVPVVVSSKLAASGYSAKTGGISEGKEKKEKEKGAVDGDL